jgi:probable O-glycosylation ligase (exosortase A-associated)
MRDIALTVVVLASLPFILWRPYIGILMWTWIGIMNPHRLCWGFAYDAPFALVVGLVTLVSVLMSREPKKIPWTWETILLAALVAWMTLTTFFAFYPQLAWPHLEKVAKIQLMIFVTIMVMHSKQRINLLVWVMALSLAFYGVKGGIFTITHGGTEHVRGPEGSFIGGDNEMGLALVMAIPLLRYLQLQSKSILVRQGITAAIVLTALAAVGSQSRGALLGIISMGTFFWLKSRNKLFTSLLGVVAAALILTIMPQQWFDRMSTIRSYEQDASAMGRINAWQTAFNVAKDRPFGGGFDSFRPPTFAIYAPDPEEVHDSHSIYFGMLGDHGFVGLALFLMLGVATWRAASGVIKRARGDPENRWAANLCAMVQVSIIGYASAGAFLGLAYFDLYYDLIAVVVLCKVLVGSQRAVAGPKHAKSAADPLPALSPGKDVTERPA